MNINLISLQILRETGPEKTYDEMTDGEGI